MTDDIIYGLTHGSLMCYRILGNTSDPALLLIPGNGFGMTQKTGALAKLLSPPDNPHCIIMYEPRDTGRSTAFPNPPVGQRAYTFETLSDDIIDLIVHLQLRSVGIVGISSGGPVAWLTAVRLPPPNVVTSLGLVLTSPVGGEQNMTDNLPPEYEEGTQLLADAYSLPEDPGDDEAWINLYQRLDLALATKPLTEEEEAESKRESEETYFREKESWTLWSKANQAGASSGRWPREELKKVACPTVIIHAAKDQFFPLEHAEAMREDVKGATLVVVEDCGHELPYRVRPVIAEAILANANRGQQNWPL